MDINKLLSDFSKKHGDGSVMVYGEKSKLDIKRVPSGLPTLDIIIGGGIPVGRILQIYGANSSGKTSVCIKILSQFQKNDKKRVVAFIDMEHALDPDYAEAIGLDMKQLLISQPDSAEQALNIVCDLVDSGQVSCIVLDSVARLVPRKEIEGEIGDAEMGMRSRLIGQALRKITPLANKKDCTVIFINQVRQAIGVMYGPTEVVPSGIALGFDSSLILRISSKKDKEDDKISMTTMKVVKNKVGGKPFEKTEIPIIFGKGYDYEEDYINAGLLLGIITQPTTRSYDFQGEKWVGAEPMKEAIKSNKDKMDKLIQLVDSEIKKLNK